METSQLDSIDQAYLDQLMIARDGIARPRLGDFVRFPTGEVERFSHDMDDSLQTSPEWSGSYFLWANGNASFSGGLNPPISTESLTLSEESLQGNFWFFHHNSAGAGRGVGFSIPCRTYATTADYRGFITRM